MLLEIIGIRLKTPTDHHLTGANDEVVCLNRTDYDFTVVYHFKTITENLLLLQKAHKPRNYFTKKSEIHRMKIKDIQQKV